MSSLKDEKGTAYWLLAGKPRGKRPREEDQDIGGWILERWDGVKWTGLAWQAEKLLSGLTTGGLWSSFQRHRVI
jgi:hypothetical protein